MLDEKKLQDQPVEIPEESAPEKSVEELKDQDIRKTIKEIIKSPKDIEDLASSEDSQLLIKSVGLYQQIRDALVDELGYPRKEGKYFSPETGIEITKKMKEFYPDSLIARLVGERINNFGSDAPEGSDKLQEFLANQEDLSV